MTDDTLLAILRRAIMEPDVDLHRLVFADRLDELRQGQRAEYVRESVLRPDIFRLFEEAPAWSELPAGIVPSWLRGFVCELTCDAVTFLKHADELVWHETQTVEKTCSCEMYGRNGWVLNFEGKWEKCKSCSGTGKRHIPRPCPPTAQPIRKVVLTTPIALADHGDYFLIVGDDMRERIPSEVLDAIYAPDTIELVCLRYRFPGGIKFELPPFAGGTEAQSDDGDQDDPAPDDDSGPSYITGNTWK